MDVGSTRGENKNRRARQGRALGPLKTAAFGCRCPPTWATQRRGTPCTNSTLVLRRVEPAHLTRYRMAEMDAACAETPRLALQMKAAT